jgi:hypothetical protein
VEVCLNLKVLLRFLNPSDVHRTVRQSRYWIPIAVRKGEKLAGSVHRDSKDTWESRKTSNHFFFLVTKP